LSDMHNQTKKYTKATLILAMVASALVAMLAWETLRSPGQAVAAAKFDPLDAGVQRQTQIREQQRTNARLEEIIRLLKSGKLRVVATPAKTTRKNAPR